MTLMEVKEYLNDLNDAYNELCEKSTSVQFKKNRNIFIKEHNITIDNWGDVFTAPIQIHDTCIVSDVGETKQRIKSFFGEKEVRCYTIWVKYGENLNFQFFAKWKNGAERLNKGQKILITGTVQGSIDHSDGRVKRDDQFRLIIRESERFSINFE